ncbi:hypothetical protein MMC19_000629 [Ptychographa xylographoides]|nr:hypothetical protein [Ptychographa xylographoides]
MATTPPTPHAHPVIPPFTFPAHAHPRAWLLTSAASPLGVALARAILAHGDSAVLCVEPCVLVDLGWSRSGAQKHWWGNPKGDGVAIPGRGIRVDDFARFVREEVRGGEWEGRAAVAEAVEAFGKIDILFCATSEAVIGTIEELAASQNTQTLIREQFETNFFGPVNIIKAALPAMREKRAGHIIALTGITSHLGTPGLGIYCASGWALEGFCDSLAYEVAPFNIKMTIIQPNLEINVLTNKVSSAPMMPAYSPDSHPAPLSRSIIGGLLERLEPPSPPLSDADSPTDGHSQHPSALHSTEKVEVIFPLLGEEMKGSLLAETIHALTAVGGHENPPARHIVGYEAVASVKEKLKTVSEELEDFVEISGAVDIDEGQGDVGDAGSGEGA